MAEFLFSGDRVEYTGDAFRHGNTAILYPDEGTVIEVGNEIATVLFDVNRDAGPAPVAIRDLRYLAPGE